MGTLTDVVGFDVCHVFSRNLPVFLQAFSLRDVEEVILSFRVLNRQHFR